MLEKLDYLCKAADIVVLAGSLPRKVDVDIYAKLTTQVKSHGVTVLFDAYGEPLRQGIKAGPDVVFPNQSEAEMVIGYEFSGDEDLVRAPQSLREMGARSAVVTHRQGCVAQLMGPEGPITLVGRAPRVDVVANVGAENALVGGYAARLLEGDPPLECLRFGLATSAANALKYGAGVFDAGDVYQLIDAVEIEEVPAP
jgi:fructose-1-phosphate kinase PfkB-like protein